jgi:hypothetical protein
MSTLTPAQRYALDAAGWVLLDLEAITDEQHATLRAISEAGRYSDADAHLVRMALESYADAHA